MPGNHEKAKHIRVLILDVDGILTSGKIFYQEQGHQILGFHIHDGLGIKLLQKAGIEVAVISGRQSEALTRRLSELNIRLAYLGQEDKRPAYNEIRHKLQLEDQAMAYMGDDLPDLPLLTRAGFAISVPSAPAVIRQHVDLITHQQAGDGAVREACDFIMNAQDLYQPMVQSYLSNP
ncbi:MAG: hypothetical protein A3E85_00345 [Gammaproteobacteria bacterium RIFCSPHIGHO2_12_FULL_45_12]|nr:MAG: hypothetical protein A3E85_00345 [Gammaproteobacteria bacterium RIFCSPHIGHO2_12_FULL_45_12]